ncbi:MAG: hotdog fold thioesterase [Chitinophagales bacterium]|nr:hotdog fold thioesterase [Bacteroidota bacterium]MCB9044064.1 hotdog fold thioesterase [Chitinophagales bacterium]
MSQKLASAVVQKMMEKDYFSRWLGIKVLNIEAGKCRLEMQIRREMLNGFGIAHGGIAYALADSALAFAANSHGIQAVSIETQISHLKAVAENDQLLAIAQETHLGKTLARYDVHIFNQKQEKVAIFKGTVYRTGKVWEV